jgi:hypothetical protein
MLNSKAVGLSLGPMFPSGTPIQLRSAPGEPERRFRIRGRAPTFLLGIYSDSLELSEQSIN